MLRFALDWKENSTLNLGGTFTVADIGTTTRSGGTIHLRGTLMNAETTFTLDETTGPWVLQGGKIIGGTVGPMPVLDTVTDAIQTGAFSSSVPPGRFGLPGRFVYSNDRQFCRRSCANRHILHTHPAARRRRSGTAESL